MKFRLKMTWRQEQRASEREQAREHTQARKTDEQRVLELVRSLGFVSAAAQHLTAVEAYQFALANRAQVQGAKTKKDVIAKVLAAPVGTAWNSKSGGRVLNLDDYKKPQAGEATQAETDATEISESQEYYDGDSSGDWAEGNE